MKIYEKKYVLNILYVRDPSPPHFCSQYTDETTSCKRWALSKKKIVLNIIKDNVRSIYVYNAWVYITYVSVNYEWIIDTHRERDRYVDKIIESYMNRICIIDIPYALWEREREKKHKSKHTRERNRERAWVRVIEWNEKKILYYKHRYISKVDT